MPQVPRQDETPYSNTIARIRAREAGKLRQSLTVSGAVVPDRSAEIQAMSQKTGLPTGFVERNFDELQKRARYTDLEALRTKSPGTVNWLSSHPDNMAVAHDDTESLGVIERILGYGKEGASALTSALPSVNAGLAGILQ